MIWLLDEVDLFISKQSAMCKNGPEVSFNILFRKVSSSAILFRWIQDYVICGDSEIDGSPIYITCKSFIIKIFCFISFFVKMYLYYFDGSRPACDRVSPPPPVGVCSRRGAGRGGWGRGHY